jgi:hypothetical protein
MSGSDSSRLVVGDIAVLLSVGNVVIEKEPRDRVRRASRHVSRFVARRDAPAGSLLMTRHNRRELEDEEQQAREIGVGARETWAGA